MARPVIKWAGGKTALLPELMARVPASFGTYYEPFAGGAALFFALKHKNSVLSDANMDLMMMYRALAKSASWVCEHLEALSRVHCKEHYLAARQQWNIGRGTERERAALFIYLNKTCFNGLWRVNRKGEFNVPFGSRKFFPDREAIIAAGERLATATLRTASFERVITFANAGDLVYLDPPYDREASTSFTSYTPGGFDAVQQRRLATIARDLVRRGCYVILSNSDTPLIRELYRDFTIETVMNRRSVGARANSRGTVAELLITS